MFQSKEAKFKEKYHRSSLEWADEECWWKVLDDAKTAGKRHLDVAQLVKHYFGISNYLRKHGGNATLLYLFWEPLNWNKVAVCRQHRAEVEELAKRVRGSRVKFEWKTHPQLWKEWSTVPLLASHATNLKTRCDTWPWRPCCPDEPDRRNSTKHRRMKQDRPQRPSASSPAH